MPPPTDFSAMDCSVARTLDVIGDKWSLLILRDAFYGVRRFDDFREDLGIARNVLTDRLQKLVATGVFERRRYEERPPRYEYRLTDKGRALLPVLLAMIAWGDRWANDSDIPPVTLTHTACGCVTHAVVACDHCGEELTLREVRVDPVRVKGANRAVALEDVV
ncbi:MAG TPA: helix-turn-helix domain-containing protein [Actinomycetota bacterium]|nr:helix-turn-helix domain-containing protein [Actinomycetota bacterium]